MNKSLIRNGNIFLQSSPKELLDFREFLEQHKSHRITVTFDGLNIASCTRGTSQHKTRMVCESAPSSFLHLLASLCPHVSAPRPVCYWLVVNSQLDL